MCVWRCICKVSMRLNVFINSCGVIGAGCYPIDNTVRSVCGRRYILDYRLQFTICDFRNWWHPPDDEVSSFRHLTLPHCLGILSSWTRCIAPSTPTSKHVPIEMCMDWWGWLNNTFPPWPSRTATTAQTFRTRPRFIINWSRRNSRDQPGCDVELDPPIAGFENQL